MTTDHPVYVLGRGYVQAHKLTTTDEVMFGGVCTTFVHGIEPIPTPERVYNIRVANCHNYFASGILVHNCDDVHAASEAYSIADRENALRWFRETWSNRLNDASKDVMMVIGQRIHENDVSGLILEERKDWVHLNLPAEFEPARKCTTVLGRTDPRTVEGELLWPERFNAETLSRYKRDLGSMGFAAQYQQTPVPSEGGTFKKAWIRYFTETPVAYVLETSTGSRSVLKEACWRFTVVDLAISLKQSADYTVIATFDVTPQHDLLLIDMIRDHIDNPAQQKAIRMTYINLEPRFIKIESVGYQLAIIQTLRNTPEDVNHFLVTSANPEMLDQTLRQLPGGESFLMRDIFDGYRSPSPEVYVACVVGDVDFFKFSVERQGYCTIVGQPGYDPHQVSIPVREYKPVKDKVSRASVAAIHMENEKLLFRKNDAMLPDVEGEVLRFPFGGHDDIVDILSMASDEVTYNKYSGLPMLLYTEEEAKVAAIEKEKEEKLNHERQLLGIPMLLEDDIEFK